MQSIGERLEEARKRKGVTIREAAEATKIRGEYLNSFENNNFSINVPDIYVRGFLRSYCNFLKLNGEKVITDYNATLIGEAKAAKREHREFFGRMEIQQQPLVQEEKRNAGSIDDAELAAEEDQPKAGFLDNVDKETAIKVGIVAVIAILLIVIIIWLFSALTSGGADDRNNAQGANQIVPVTQNSGDESAAKTFYLIATGDVRVSVTERSGKVILDSQPLVSGQRMPLSVQDSIRIDFSEGNNLQAEINGQKFKAGRTGGPGSVSIPYDKL